ncbi:MAG: hypothetical protein MHPSP_003284, partial [Paramarteilia canceri]
MANEQATSKISKFASEYIFDICAIIIDIIVLVLLILLGRYIFKDENNSGSSLFKSRRNNTKKIQSNEQLKFKELNDSNIEFCLICGEEKRKLNNIQCKNYKKLFEEKETENAEHLYRKAFKLPCLFCGKDLGTVGKISFCREEKCFAHGNCSNNKKLSKGQEFLFKIGLCNRKISVVNGIFENLFKWLESELRYSNFRKQPNETNVKEYVLIINGKIESAEPKKNLEDFKKSFESDKDIINFKCVHTIIKRYYSTVEVPILTIEEFNAIADAEDNFIDIIRTKYNGNSDGNNNGKESTNIFKRTMDIFLKFGKLNVLAGTINNNEKKKECKLNLGIESINDLEVGDKLRNIIKVNVRKLNPNIEEYGQKIHDEMNSMFAEVRKRMDSDKKFKDLVAKKYKDVLTGGVVILSGLEIIDQDKVKNNS